MFFYSTSSSNSLCNRTFSYFVQKASYRTMKTSRLHGIPVSTRFLASFLEKTSKKLAPYLLFIKHFIRLIQTIHILRVLTGMRPCEKGF